VERYGLIHSSGKKKRMGDEMERKAGKQGEKRAGIRGLVAFILVEWNGAGQAGLLGCWGFLLANHTSFLLTQTDSSGIGDQAN